MTMVFLAGAGFIAREHASAAYQHAVASDGVELHVADPNPQALAAFQELYPDAVAYEDAATMFAKSGGGGVAVIATPPVTHAPLVAAALEGGLHVLCEKPLAMSADEALEMSSRAHELGLILDSCDSRFRDVPATRYVAELVRADTLGPLYHVTFVNTLRRSRTGIDSLTESGWFRDPRVSGGGALMDWGPYDLAALDEVLRPVRVEIHHAWASSPLTGGPFSSESRAAEQHVGAAMTVTTEAGALVPVTYERAAATHGEERSIVQVDGESASVAWDWLDWTGNSARLTVDQDGSPHTTTTTFDPPAVGFHGRPLARILRSIENGDDPAGISRSSVFTFAWLRAILDAANTGTARVVERDPSFVGAIS